LSQTLNSFSAQIAEGGVSLNTDIFEANLINLLILGGALFYFLGGALSDSLSKRKEKTLEIIQDSEERLQEAIERLTESETQLAQAQMVIESISKDAEVIAKEIEIAILADGKTEIERLIGVTKSQITTIESKVRKQISDYVIALALKQLTMRLESRMTMDLQQKIIEKNISKLAE